MEDLKEQVKQLIRDNGGYVSIIDSPGPITLIFTHVISDIWQDREKFYPRNSYIYWQKMAVEMGTYKVENLQTLVDETIIPVVKQTKKLNENQNPIFKLHTVERVNGLIYIRMAVIMQVFGTQIEVDMDTAKEIIADPEKFGLQNRYEFIQDLKVIYGL